MEKNYQDKNPPLFVHKSNTNSTAHIPHISPVEILWRGRMELPTDVLSTFPLPEKRRNISAK